MRYTIIAGGRRRVAAEIAGLTTLPVVIRDEEAGRARVLQLVENIQRRALAPLDEAHGFKELIDAEGISAEALGERLHVSGQHVRTRLLLLSDQVVADAVARDQITPTTAREVLRLPDESRATLRARIETGDALGEANIRTAREQSVATGAVNPRAKGGGRVSRVGSVARAQDGKAAVPEPTNPGDYQPAVDPAPAALVDRDTPRHRYRPRRPPREAYTASSTSGGPVSMTRWPDYPLASARSCVGSCARTWRSSSTASTMVRARESSAAKGVPIHHGGMRFVRCGDTR